jgi:2-oxoglutarate dehydrogenase E2 component (dihydrolipoamide succinyltransferase)
MARINIILPAMGEGVIEATINKWLIKKGSVIKEDDPIAEVATDKVDTEIPSPVTGTVVEILLGEGAVAKVGEPIAVAEDNRDYKTPVPEIVDSEVKAVKEAVKEAKKESETQADVSVQMKSRTQSGKFLSPLVRSIAAAEGISYVDLDGINGTGMDGRITKDDLNAWLNKGKAQRAELASPTVPATPEKPGNTLENAKNQPVQVSGTDEIIEMDRVRKLIAEHMVMSKRTSPHVTSFIDVDVTRLVNWRNSVKDKFLAREGQKLTLTPIFIDSIARAIADYPMLNSSVNGNRIIRKKNINIGMATALPDGNLIVPVIKNANEKSLTGIARSVNDLAERARGGKLKPDEITGGTFTITNFGSYDNLAGTPIINQPQVAILGTGAVRKTPTVVETPEGDAIAIRHIMILSLSYDHRIIDGALAGKFLKRIREIMQNYSPDNF